MGAAAASVDEGSASLAGLGAIIGAGAAATGGAGGGNLEVNFGFVGHALADGRGEAARLGASFGDGARFGDAAAARLGDGARLGCCVPTIHSCSLGLLRACCELGLLRAWGRPKLVAGSVARRGVGGGTGSGGGIDLPAKQPTSRTPFTPLRCHTSAWCAVLRVPAGYIHSVTFGYIRLPHSKLIRYDMYDKASESLECKGPARACLKLARGEG